MTCYYIRNPYPFFLQWNLQFIRATCCHLSKSRENWYTLAMANDKQTPEQSPEPIALLIDSLPPRILLTFIKGDPPLSRTIFHGFTARERSLSLPMVRQRLEQELQKQPAIASSLLSVWKGHFALLQVQVNQLPASPTPAQLLALTEQFRQAAVQYALFHADNKALGTLAERLPTLRKDDIIPNPLTSLTAKLTGKQGQEVERAQQKIASLTQELTKLTKEKHALQEQLHQQEKAQKTLATQLANSEKERQSLLQRVEREQRRAKTLQEEVERVKKSTKSKDRTSSNNSDPSGPTTIAVIPPPQLPALITDAILLLQRGLTELDKAASQQSEPVLAPAKANSSARTAVKKTPEASITLPTLHGKPRAYPMNQLLAGLRRNDESLLAKIRDGIALLASDPVREKGLLTSLNKAGIPDPIVQGPLRAAVVDGSNVAHLNDDKHAHVAYLGQIQRAAWREGYFPVLIIVDASLRYQIDRADHLMEMVESGEVIMAPAGTSADALIIDEVIQRKAVLISNDRMTDWPAAKPLDKRHIELSGGVAALGSFHRPPALWFH